VDVICTSEIQRVVELLELGWEDAKTRTGREGGQVDEQWPQRWLSEQHALEVMRKYEEKQS